MNGSPLLRAARTAGLGCLSWLGLLVGPGAAHAQGSESGASATMSSSPNEGERAEALDLATDSASAADQLASERWPGVSLGWDVRAEGISLFKHYTLGERDAWYSGEGIGGGLSLSLHFRPPAALTRAAVLRWMELELGASSSTHVVRWKEGEDGPRDHFVETSVSGVIGVHLGSGRWSGASAGAPWSGVAVGMAWLPTYVYFFGGDDFGSSGKLNPAGLRWTIDWARLAPGRPGVVPGLRGSITWLPYVGSMPTVFSLALGCVFY